MQPHHIQRRREMILEAGKELREKGLAAKETYLATGNRKKRRRIEAIQKRGRKAIQKVAVRLETAR